VPNLSENGSQAAALGPAGRRLLIILTVIFLWRIFVSASTNLIPDECSYWSWSRNPDWSYFDNSGMVAYLIRLSTTLFGYASPFSVRFPFLILSGASAYLLYRVGVELYANRYLALLAVVGLNLTPAALLGGSAAVHDSALLFFWIAALWAAARFVSTEDPWWFYLMGLAAGFSILSKYTGVLVVPAILIFLLWARDYRTWLRRKEPWIAALIAAAFTLPILWWNIHHDWASLYHVLYIGSGSVSAVRRLGDGLGYNLAQFLFISPLFYWAVLVALGTGLTRNFSTPKPADQLLLCFSFPLLLFGLMAFKTHVEANWAVMGYPSAAVLTAGLLSRPRKTTRAGVRTWFGPRYFQWGALIAVVTVVLIVLHAWIGLLPASVERRLGKADRVIWETRGWDGLGRHVADLREAGDVIAADSYQLCTLLEFNVPGHPHVRYLAPWRRPTQWDVWEPSYDNLKGKNILFVSPRPLDPSSHVLMTIYENFKRVERLPPYSVMYHGTEIREIFVCRGYGFDPFKPRRLGPRSLRYRD
jgi:4-amino-4-deoxy-L-arabinose transferase-like glycosyltransferase